MSSTHSEAIEAQVQHLSQEVVGLSRGHASMNATLSSQTTQIDRLSDNVDKVLDAVNAPKPQIQIWTVVGGIATLLGAMIMFVELRLTPYEVALSEVGDQGDHNTEIIVDRAEFIGAAKERLQFMETELAHQHERTHILGARMSEVEVQSAVMEGGIEDVEAHTDTVDMYGSRRWAAPPKK